jgi:hypothetical protein
MYEPVLDRHEWESEMQALEADIRDSPAEALRELDDLVSRMLEETGRLRLHRREPFHGGRGHHPRKRARDLTA